MVERPGANLFAMKLEYGYFKPGTPKNDEFLFKLAKWPKEQPLWWYVLSVPDSYKEICYEVASNTNMRIADGIPNMLTCNGIESFSLNDIDGPLYSLENAKDSKIYEGPKGVEEVVKWESEEIQKILINFEANKNDDDICKN